MHGTGEHNLGGMNFVFRFRLLSLLLFSKSQLGIFTLLKSLNIVFGCLNAIQNKSGTACVCVCVWGGGGGALKQRSDVAVCTMRTLNVKFQVVTMPTFV